tara:strand:+ start:151 stop:357 length:207 start_codon:yes stop_codon:yes gene_type:complete
VSKTSFTKGDRVLKEKVLNIRNALGTVEKITSEYVVVLWDDVNGHWHYTKSQAETLELLEEEQEAPHD